jgi:hypothetical protein
VKSRSTLIAAITLRYSQWALYEKAVRKLITAASCVEFILAERPRHLPAAPEFVDNGRFRQLSLTSRGYHTVSGQTCHPEFELQQLLYGM